jgi:FixJ family two-component response regulator
MQPGCVLLDVRMPGMGGLELQRQLNLEGAVIPVIFVTAHADVPMAVQAMSEGAFDFLQHPITPDQLRARVREAIRVDAQSRARMRERAEIEQRFHSLSDRERAVLASLIAGKSNKVIAADLGLSPRTIELYRARIMEKTHCSSLAQLIRMSMEIGFQGIKSADTRHD